MKCFRVECSKSAPKDTLFRVNHKGVPGIWACREHRIERDLELERIVDALERGEHPPKENNAPPRI